MVDVSVRDGGGEVNKWIDKSSEQGAVCEIEKERDL